MAWHGPTTPTPPIPVRCWSWPAAPPCLPKDCIPPSYPQHNRLHPYYLVYISRAGDVIHDHTQVKRLLDLGRSACKGHAQPIPAAYERFNRETADGRKMQIYSDLLSKAIRSMIEVKAERDMDSLFTGGKTTALTHAISGLDDFELIAFLVIQEVQ